MDAEKISLKYSFIAAIFLSIIIIISKYFLL